MLRPFGRRWPAVVVCDHASNAVPQALGQLGLSQRQLRDHIAWDVGAGALAEVLAQCLELPLVSAGYSRLVIDCNRRLERADSITDLSDGHSVPGNRNLTEAQRRQRIAEVFEPYHGAIDRQLTAARELASAPALIAVHSFTPVMSGRRRPWHCGILWDKDPRIPVPLLESLRRDPALEVGDNAPYDGRDPTDYTIHAHAASRGLPHVCIEVRQDLLQTGAGVAEWAGRLAGPLESILSDTGLYRTLGAT